MLTIHTPNTIAPPSSAYAHGVSAPTGARWLHVSGQVGADNDGVVAGDINAQMDLCWQRIFAILADAGMDRTNIVKVNVFLTDAADVGAYRENRDRNLAGHVAASTLLVVSALAHPDWNVEIEVIAAG